MPETAIHILLNMFQIIQMYGYMPSGSRVYFLNRSQPPFLTLTFSLIYDYMKEKDPGRAQKLLENGIGYLEAENKFWNENDRKVTGQKEQKIKRLSKYSSQQSCPRYERYVQDAEAKEKAGVKEDDATFFKKVASICESGWDFSSRWFKVACILKELQ